MSGKVAQFCKLATLRIEGQRNVRFQDLGTHQAACSLKEVLVVNHPVTYLSLERDPSRTGDAGLGKPDLPGLETAVSIEE